MLRKRFVANVRKNVNINDVNVNNANNVNNVNVVNDVDMIKYK